MKRFFDLEQAQPTLDSLGGASAIPKSKLRGLVEAAEQRLHQPLSSGSVGQPLPPVRPPLAARPQLRRSAKRLRLASGRTLRVRLVSQHDLDELRSVAAHNDLTSFEALVRHAQSIDALQRAQLRTEAKLAALQEQADLALLGNLRGLALVKQQVHQSSEQLQEQQHTLHQTRLAQRRALRAQQHLRRTENFNSALSTLQVAAYGRRGSALHSNNLTLAASQWLSTSVQPALQRVSWLSGKEAELLGWLLPLVGFGVVEATLGRQQHERYISGELTLTVAGTPTSRIDERLVSLASEFPVDFASAQLSLERHIAPGYWQQFRSRTDISARAALVRTAPGSAWVDARVEAGVLTVFGLAGRGTSVQVAWTVDTGAGS